MAEFGFGPPIKQEETVFGAQRPGFSGKFVQRQVVDEWLKFMKQQGINRVVCLLTETELGYYPWLSEGLLGVYNAEFGEDNVLWSPTEDLHLCSPQAITDICHFLKDTRVGGARVVVHCSAGLGRTGQALAAWLIYNYDLSERKAIAMLEELNRSPREAVFYRNASETELLDVLGVARILDD